ncbi:hypothetical protein N2152v2_005024 [Parachlorella kessleri]
MVAAETIKALRAASPGADTIARQAGVSRLSSAAATAADAAAAANAAVDAEQQARLLDALGLAATSRPATGADAAVSQQGASVGALLADNANDSMRLMDRAREAVINLKAELQMKEVEVAEAELRHEEAATQVLLREQEVEVNKHLLEGMRGTVHELQETQHALQYKVNMLESQAADHVSIARRRVEEQAVSLREEAAQARTFQEKLAAAEKELEAATCALHGEQERTKQLQVALGSSNEQLREVQSNLAACEKKLWKAATAQHDLEREHHDVTEQNKKLVIANRQLQATVADHKERALLADSLKEALEVQRVAAEQLQAALKEQQETVTEELQRERELRLQAEQALREAQPTVQSLRGAAEGRAGEITSLLTQLEEYANRLVQQGEAEAAAKQQEAVAMNQKRLAEEEAVRARKEAASMRASLADLDNLRHVEVSLKDQVFQNSLLVRAIEVGRDHVQLLKETLAEQNTQLESLRQVQTQCSKQQKAIASLEGQLDEADKRCSQLQKTLGEATAAKEHAEKAAIDKQAAEEKFTTHVEEWESTKSRNEVLEHLSKQQGDLLASQDRQIHSLMTQLQASQQRCRQLQQLGAAYSQAYGRLSAHTGELHSQFCRQLGSLLHLCHHVSLQLEAVKNAADVAESQWEAGVEAAQPQAVALCRAASIDGAAMATLAVEEEQTIESESGGCVGTAGAAVPGQWLPLIRLLDALHTELVIAAQLLEAQSSSAEAQLLSMVPASIASALQAVLSPLSVQPADLLANDTAGSSTPSSGGSASSPAAASGTVGNSPLASARGPQLSSPSTALLASPRSAREQRQQLEDAARDQTAIVQGSVQVSHMEAQLDRLLHDNVGLKATAQAATGLHQAELVARQQAQQHIARLQAQLQTLQAERNALKGQRDLHEGLSRQLAHKLREAAYTIRQLQVEAEGPFLSVAHRSLQDRHVQTQYCELWLRNVVGESVDCSQGAIASGACLMDLTEESMQTAAALDTQLQLQQAAAIWSLAETQRSIQDIYRHKAVQDIIVARGLQPFTPLPAFLEGFFRLQYGAASEVGIQRMDQLAASVRCHAVSDREVAMFGLAAGLLKEEELAAVNPSWSLPYEDTPATLAAANACPPPVYVDQDTAQQRLSASARGTAAPKVPQVLYNSWRQSRAQVRDAVGASLQNFQHSSWYAAYLASAARQLLPAPNPMLTLDGVPVCAEVRGLLLSTPGVPDLLDWVMAGGVAACLRGAELGIPVAENQLPQLYLMAVDACRLLGLAPTPRIYVKNSTEAAAYYLQVPATPGAFHGLHGALAEQAAPAGSRLGTPLLTAAAAAEPSVVEWDCLLVLTSALVDLLEPLELQAVVGGCLGFHAAATVPTSAAGARGASGGAAAVASMRGRGSSGRGRSSGQEAEQQGVLCRSLGAMHTLGALCALCPEELSHRLPPGLAPLFATRIQPAMLRGLRYLTLYADRFSLAVAGDVRIVTSALVKLASGSAVLRDELNLDAVLQQAQALELATEAKLPALLSREEGSTVQAGSSSLTMLRVWQLLHDVAKDKK